MLFDELGGRLLVEKPKIGVRSDGLSLRFGHTGVLEGLVVPSEDSELMEEPRSLGQVEQQPAIPGRVRAIAVVSKRGEFVYLAPAFHQLVDMAIVATHVIRTHVDGVVLRSPDPTAEILADQVKRSLCL
jgi:hypothetical protein